MRCGKDTVGRILEAEHGFTRLAVADPIRQQLERLNPRIASATGVKSSLNDVLASHRGWEAVKDSPDWAVPVRRLLQEYGLTARQEHGTDVWVTELRTATLRLMAAGKRVVITDARFENEIQMVDDLLGINIHVYRRHPPPPTGNEDPVSETDLTGRKWKYKLEMKADSQLSDRISALIRKAKLQ